MNRWNIPSALEQEIRARDQECVYCGVQFAHARADRRKQASWEHIINDARIITRENIARCCVGCNASKGTKPLLEWLRTKYCERKGITLDTVAPVVKAAIAASSQGQSG